MKSRETGEWIKVGAVWCGLATVGNVLIILGGRDTAPRGILLYFELIYILALLLAFWNLKWRQLHWSITLSCLLLLIADGILIVVGGTGGHDWLPPGSDNYAGFMVYWASFLLKVPMAVFLGLAICQEKPLRKQMREVLLREHREWNQLLRAIQSRDQQPSSEKED